MEHLERLRADLDEAVHLASQYSGGYSGEYLSAEAFCSDLRNAVEKFQRGDLSVVKQLRRWFAPTCEWDDFISDGGVELGNRVYSSLLKIEG